MVDGRVAVFGMVSYSVIRGDPTHRTAPAAESHDGGHDASKANARRAKPDALGEKKRASSGRQPVRPVKRAPAGASTRRGGGGTSRGSCGRRTACRPANRAGPAAGGT